MGGVGGGSPYHRCYRHHDEDDHVHDDHVDVDDVDEDDHDNNDDDDDVEDEDDHDVVDDVGGCNYDWQGALPCIVQMVVGKMMVIVIYKEHK